MTVCGCNLTEYIKSFIGINTFAKHQKGTNSDASCCDKMYFRTVIKNSKGHDFRDVKWCQFPGEVGSDR